MKTKLKELGLSRIGYLYACVYHSAWNERSLLTTSNRESSIFPARSETVTAYSLLSLQNSAEAGGMEVFLWAKESKDMRQKMWIAIFKNSIARD